MAKGATPARPRGQNGEPRAPKMRQDWLKRSQVAAKMDARCPNGRQKWSQDGPGSQPARPGGQHGEPRAPKKQNRANLPRGMQFLGPGRQVSRPAVGSRRWGGRWGCILIWSNDQVYNHTPKISHVHSHPPSHYICTTIALTIGAQTDAGPAPPPPRGFKMTPRWLKGEPR